MDPRQRISAKAAMWHDYFCDLPTKIHDLPEGIDCLYYFTFNDL
jgi:hypothetical protein